MSLYLHIIPQFTLIAKTPRQRNQFGQIGGNKQPFKQKGDIGMYDFPEINSPNTCWFFCMQRQII